tara:strand:- start:10213 stop:10569 length:357 start_codon:yes stop_codon:yes gene_type:complete
MSTEYLPRVGEKCQYKEYGSTKWCLCEVLAYHENKVWIKNYSVGSNPVKRINSVLFQPVVETVNQKPAVISEKQAAIITDELIPMIVDDMMPLLKRVIEKRLNLFAAEIINVRNGGAV